MAYNITILISVMYKLKIEPNFVVKKVYKDCHANINGD
jgi:hypothetical protein